MNKTTACCYSTFPWIYCSARLCHGNITCLKRIRSLSLCSYPLALVPRHQKGCRNVTRWVVREIHSMRNYPNALYQSESCHANLFYPLTLLENRDLLHQQKEREENELQPRAPNESAAALFRTFLPRNLIFDYHPELSIIRFFQKSTA